MVEKQVTKLCKYCKTEIPVGAKVCPNCRKKQSGVLKWVIIGVVIIGIFSAVAGGGSDKDAQVSDNSDSQNSQMSAQNPSNSKEDPLSDDIIDVEISDCTVKYIKHEIVENMAGDKCVAVYYEFTNNSDEGKTFDYTVSDKAFQNGVELDTSLFYVDTDNKDSSSEIKPGVSVEVCSGFVLRDDTTDIELEIGAWITLKDSPDDKMILSIK
ncbi:MAG: DUF5067 domain-containing protein [Lachnospiraceae bacterium]|nr:DUF5067 domain-containing protein [Lachnospiraceae bacterium]